MVSEKPKESGVHDAHKLDAAPHDASGDAARGGPLTLTWGGHVDKTPTTILGENTVTYVVVNTVTVAENPKNCGHVGSGGSTPNCRDALWEEEKAVESVDDPYIVATGISLYSG